MGGFFKNLWGWASPARKLETNANIVMFCSFHWKSGTGNQCRIAVDLKPITTVESVSIYIRGL
jgi:hypothetical protein